MVQPIVTYAVSLGLNNVRVLFSDPMTGGLSTTSHYSIPGLTVTVATPSDDTTYVDLTTTGMVRGTSYTVTVASPPIVDGGAQTLAVASATFVGAHTPANLVEDITIPSAFRVAASAAVEGSAFLPVEVELDKKTSGQIVFDSLQANQREFVMRARHKSDGLVWWVSLGAPDFVGSQSGFAPDQLEDIVLAGSP